MLGRGVSVGVTDGVTGDDVIVNVGVRVAVGLGLVVCDGGMDGKATCVVAGAQAPRRRRMIKATRNNFFIQLNANS